MENKNVLFTSVDGTLITSITGKSKPTSLMDISFRMDVLRALKKHFENIEGGKYLLIVENSDVKEDDNYSKRLYHAKMEYIICCLNEYFDEYDLFVNICSCPRDSKFASNVLPNTGLFEIHIKTSGIKPNDLDKMIVIGNKDSSVYEESSNKLGVSYIDADELAKKYK